MIAIRRPLASSNQLRTGWKSVEGSLIIYRKQLKRYVRLWNSREIYHGDWAMLGGCPNYEYGLEPMLLNASDETSEARWDVWKSGCFMPSVLHEWLMHLIRLFHCSVGISAVSWSLMKLMPVKGSFATDQSLLWYPSQGGQCPSKETFAWLLSKSQSIAAGCFHIPTCGFCIRVWTASPLLRKESSYNIMALHVYVILYVYLTITYIQIMVALF